MGRPSIPAETKRAVLIEAGHRCAIAECRHPDVDIHHIIPWETCKKHEYRNLIALCPNCHRRVHKGEIDNKSLIEYKAALISAIRNLGSSAFEHPIIEVKRRIYSIDNEDPSLIFDFEFPDFAKSDALIASKNIEGWGITLLEAHNESVKEVKQGDYHFPLIGARLIGRYEIIRRDSAFLSVSYIIDSFYGGAHGSRETRVQNFMLEPFTPILLDDLLSSEASLPLLSEIIRAHLLQGNPERNTQWMLQGTEPEPENFSCFTIDHYTINFVFREYQIDCYAAGTETVYLSFSELGGIVKPEILDKLIELQF